MLSTKLFLIALLCASTLAVSPKLRKVLKGPCDDDVAEPLTCEVSNIIYKTVACTAKTDDWRTVLNAESGSGYCTKEMDNMGRVSN